MEEAAPRGVHALSFASLAHKSFIKVVSFAYTEGRKVPPRTGMKNRYKGLLQALRLFESRRSAAEESGFLCVTTILAANLLRVAT